MWKYLTEMKELFAARKRGIEANISLWQNQTITPVMLQEKITQLDEYGQAIDRLKEQVAVKQAEARAFYQGCGEFAERLDSLIIGLEGNSVEKLTPYGIQPQAKAVKKESPVKTLIPVIEDDRDGVGFILTTQSDPAADNYEWEKGIGSDATKPDAIPEFKHLAVTQKLSYLDDDVPKGVRIFYRVRAINRAGVGPWSLAVSRVQ